MKINTRILQNSPVKRLLWLLLVSLLVSPFVWLGWKDLWNTFLEQDPPKLIISELPAGIGLTPTNLSFTVSDQQAGIDEIIVRIRQRNRTLEIYKNKFQRTKQEKLAIELPADPSVIIEGALELEIATFDASFWNNRSVKKLELQADYRRPQLSLHSTQHNIRAGGSQLVIYTVKDDNLAIHGIRVGRKAYYGVPIKDLDRAFKQKDLYVALFSVDLNSETNQNIKIFAEDLVGNGASISFPKRIMPTNYNIEKRKVTNKYLEQTILSLYKNNWQIISDFSATQPNLKLPNPDNTLSLDEQLSAFEAVHLLLGAWSELELQRHLKVFRSDRLWPSANLPIAGTAFSSYGKTLHYELSNQKIFESVQNGYELIPIASQVTAINNGIVAFAGAIGNFGNIIALDHGLGLFSLYAWLGETTVKSGDRILAGQLIAYTGQSGLGSGREYLYQLRLHGQTIDPREWSDKSWYLAHIIDKVNQAKGKFGLPILLGELSAL